MGSQSCAKLLVCCITVILIQSTCLQKPTNS